jgi:DNA helicase HerA-like ATPase
MSKPIGKTSSTRNQTNTSDEFSLWLEGQEKINPTDIVVTQNSDESSTYGMVTRIENISDSESHLDNFVSHDFGNAAIEPRTERLSSNVARCAVLKNTENIYMPVVGGQNVEFPDPEGILTAIGIGEMEKVDPNFDKYALPAGIIEQSDGTQAPAIIDGRYVLGPEGAHFNISGISGLAAKTSYAMFLLNAMLQKRDDVAIVIFNVKHNDLYYIDQPTDPPPQDDQKELWDVLGVEPEEFKNVKYFMPRGKTGGAFAYTPLPNDYSIYAYNLERMKGKLSYLFADVADPTGALRLLVEDVMEDLEQNSQITRGGTNRVDTFLDLISAFSGSGKYKVHHPGTAGKFLRNIKNFTQTGTTGLFVNNPTDGEVNLAEHIWAIQPKQVYVIDIARLRDFERAFVVGDVVNEVNKLFAGEIEYNEVSEEVRPAAWENVDLESSIKPPDKVVFFVDELNKYAPSGKAESPILHNLLEIAERGRSLGITLLGVEQFASQIHSRVTGNCSNKVYGRSDSTELSDQAYRHIPQDLKSLITRLDQGELLLQHPLYRQPVKIRFPKPVYKQPGH